MFADKCITLLAMALAVVASRNHNGRLVSNLEADVEELVLEDKNLNATRSKAWNHMLKFLSSGKKEEGFSSLEAFGKYLMDRRVWIETIHAQFPNPGILVDGTLFSDRKHELNGTQNIYYMFKIIHDTSWNYSVLEELNKQFKNLSFEFDETYDYDVGVTSIQLTEDYIMKLELVDTIVRGFNASLLSCNISSHLVRTWISNIPYIQECQRNLNITRESLVEQKTLMSRIEAYNYFRDYIDPPVYIIILLTGLVWNIVLLMMFAQKKEIRTAPNIMIFNIVMADVLNLTFNLPLQYFGSYYPESVKLSEPICVLFISLRCMFTSASALSVVALSAQRFCATLPAFHKLRARCHLTPIVITTVYILLIWAAASSIVLPDTLLEKVCDDQPTGKSARKSAKVVSLHEFLIYCFALPGIMLFFTVLTARRLKQSAKEIPGEVKHKVHEDARNRGAKVVTALCIVFTVSYVPFFLWGRIATELSLNRWKLPYRILDNITYYLLFSNPCFNPLALYVTSRTFRRLFNGYFLVWCLKRKVLMRTDTQLSYDNTTQSSKQQESDI